MLLMLAKWSMTIARSRIRIISEKAMGYAGAVQVTTALDGKMRLHGKVVQVSERALELATALEAELLGQCDKLEATMQRPEFALFPIDERNEIERKHAEISGLLTQADFMKYQISRL
jgi:hypothetical protein